MDRYLGVGAGRGRYIMIPALSEEPFGFFLSSKLIDSRLNISNFQDFGLDDAFLTSFLSALVMVTVVSAFCSTSMVEEDGLCGN